MKKFLKELSDGTVIDLTECAAVTPVISGGSGGNRPWEGSSQEDYPSEACFTIYLKSGTWFEVKKTLNKPEDLNVLKEERTELIKHWRIE